MANIDRALASMERRFAQHNTRMQAMFGGATRSGRAGAGASVGAVAKQVVGAQEKEQLASQRRLASAAARLDAQRSRALYSQYQQSERAQAKQHRQALSDLKRENAERARFVQGTVGRGAGRVLGAARATAGLGLAMTGIGGAALAASAVSQAMDVDERARRLSVAATGAGEKPLYTPEELKRRFATVSTETGISQEGLAGAAQTFVAKTGDIKTPIENLKTFATVAQATGASIEDVASTAADLMQKFDIKKTEDMADALAVLTMQGKKGAFELRDMANTFPEMSAAAQRAGLHGVKGMRTLGGLAQLSRQSTGSGEEASTALQMMLTQLIAKSGELKSGKALGGKSVNVFEGGDPTKAARDIPTVLAEVISKSHGNLQELGQLFDVRGVRAASPMISAYRTAAENTKGTAQQKEAAGKKAVLDLINDASNAAGTFADVQKDATDVMKSFNVQWEQITTQLKIGMADELFPAIQKLLPEMVKLIGPTRTVATVMVKLAEALLDNPLKSLGAVLAASVAYEVVKAKLGDVLSNAVKNMVGAAGGAAGGNPEGAAFNSKAGLLGAVGTGASIGTAMALTIYATGVTNIETSEANMKQSGRDLQQVRSAGVDDLEMVRQKVREHRDRLFTLKDPSLTQQASNLISFGTKTDQTQINTEENMLKEMEQKMAALDVMKDAADEHLKAAKAQQDAAAALTAAAGKQGGNGPNRGNAPSPVKG
jgi:uncharacterized spore protein YtfJ